MSTITKISTQRRNKQRYNIFIDESYAFSVDEDLLVKYNLHKGMEVNDQELVDVLEADSLHQSYLMAVRYLGYRMRSIKEMQDYLYKKEVDHSHIEMTIIKLLNEGYLDDEQFAKAFIADRMNQSTKGPTVIKRELAEKGVKPPIVDHQIKVFSFDDQLKTALKWAENRAKGNTRESLRKRKERLRSGLMGRGFTSDVINEVLTLLDEEITHGGEWDAVVYQGDRIYRRQSRRYSGYELINRLKAGLFSRGFSSKLVQRYVDQLDEEK